MIHIGAEHMIVDLRDFNEIKGATQVDETTGDVTTVRKNPYDDGITTEVTRLHHGWRIVRRR